MADVLAGVEIAFVKPQACNKTADIRPEFHTYFQRTGILPAVGSRIRILPEGYAAARRRRGRGRRRWRRRGWRWRRVSDRDGVPGSRGFEVRAVIGGAA